jgi:hypothetical protein
MLNPRVLREMPPKIEPYDGTADYDKHVEHIDTVDSHLKCKLFVLTLKWSTMTWFKGLSDGSIRSWRDLCEEVNSHFTM